VTDRLDLPEATWTRVSPLYKWPEMGSYALSGLVVAALSAFTWFSGAWWAYSLTAVILVVTAVVVAFVPRRVRAIGYQLREDDLLVRRGILFLRFVAVPYGRMQLIDVNRGPIVRALGLSDLKFVTAAASSAVTIPGVPADEAERLRDRLVDLAETRRAGL
jgi:membrane protein YdbS with pleckstrin-like domain